MLFRITCVIFHHFLQIRKAEKQLLESAGATRLPKKYTAKSKKLGKLDDRVFLRLAIPRIQDAQAVLLHYLNRVRAPCASAGAGAGCGCWCGCVHRVLVRVLVLVQVLFVSLTTVAAGVTVVPLCHLNWMWGCV